MRGIDGCLSISQASAGTLYLRDKVPWELTMFAQIIDDPAICGHWLINLTNYKDPLVLRVISHGLELEEPNHMLLKLKEYCKS